jgi:hypothetical protein
MKKYIVGSLFGAIIASSVTAYADEGLEKIEAYIRKGLPITLNGAQVQLESPPVMVDGSTYLKLRDVAGLTGLQVNWNEATQTIELSNDSTQKKSGSISPNTENSIIDNAKAKEMIFYQHSELNKYLEAKHKDNPRYLSSKFVDGKLIVLLDGSEFEVNNLGENHHFHDTTVNEYYNSEEYYLQYISSDLLKQLQKYRLDTNGNKMEPIKL